MRSGALDVIAIDSVAALMPKAEIEGEMGDSHVGLQARLMTQALRKLAGTLNRAGTICIFTNQLREKIGVMFGSPETTPGGRALKFYASVRLDIRRIETLKEGVEAFGNRVRVKVVKNKVAPPFQQAEFDIIYGTGISWEGTVLDTAVERKVVQKSGAYFSFGDERLGQGRHNATAFLREHPDVCQQILGRHPGAGRAGADRLGAGARLAAPRWLRRGGTAGEPAEEAEENAKPGERQGAGGRRLAGASAASPDVHQELPRDRVALELDGHPWRVVPTSAVARSGLWVWAWSSTAGARGDFRRELRRAEALEAAAPGARPAGAPRAPSSMPGSSGEESTPSVRGEALDRLEELGAVDDERDSLRRARAQLAGRGYGDAAIVADLEQRGVEACAGYGGGRLASQPERERARAVSSNAWDPARRRQHGISRAADSARTSSSRRSGEAW